MLRSPRTKEPHAVRSRPRRRSARSRSSPWRSWRSSASSPAALPSRPWPPTRRSRDAGRGRPGRHDARSARVVTFHGRGYGHGVGMSQYGARGRALDGSDRDRRSWPTTTRARRSARSPPTRRSGCGCSTTSRPPPTKPLVLYGRRGHMAVDGSGTIYPERCPLEVRPTVTDDRVGHHGRLARQGHRRRTARSCATRGDRSLPVRGLATTAVFQVASRTSTYDQYRGLAPDRPADHASPSPARRTSSTLERYLRGVVPAEMPSTWPAEALRGAVDRRPLLRGAPPATGRVVLRRRRRLELAGLPAACSARRRPRPPRSTRRPASCSRAARRSPTRCSTRPGGGATEHNENVYVSSTGAKVASPVSYLRGSSDRRAGRDGLRLGLAVRHVEDARPTRGRSCRPGSGATAGPRSGRSRRSTCATAASRAG